MNNIHPDEAIEERNSSYLAAMKDGILFNVYSGWRMWRNSSVSQILHGADAPAFNFQYTEWTPIADDMHSEIHNEIE